MMEKNADHQKKIISLLRLHHNGLSITDISRRLKINRNSTAKYLEMLLISGDVTFNTFGPAKVYTVARKIPLSAILRFSADIIILLDKELRVIDANENAISYLKINRNDLIGQKITELSDPVVSRLPFHDAVKESTISAENVRELAVPDGERERYFRVRLIPTVFDSQEEGLTIIGEDITGRKEAEDRLRESEERYRNVVEDQTELICRFLPDGTHIFVNEAYCRFFEKTRDKIIGSHFLPDISREDKTLISQLLASLTPRDPLREIVHRIRAPDGSCRWLRWTDRAIFSPDGTIKEYQSVGRDITEAKDAELAIRQSETKFREIFDKTNDAIHIHLIRADGLPGRLIDINESGCRMLGYSREELLEKNPLEFSTEYHNPPLEEIGRSLTTKGHATIETGHIRKDGAVIPVEINAHLVELAGQRVVLSVIRDITKRKEEDHRLRAQHTLAMALHGSRNLQGMLDSCLSAALEISGLDAGGIYLVNHTTGSLDLTASLNLSEPFVAATMNYPADSPNTKIVMAGKAFTCPYSELGISVSDVERQQGFRAIAVIPILWEGQVIACFIGVTRSRDTIPEPVMVMLETVSAQIGMVIARVRAEEALRKSELLHRTILNNVQDVYYRCDTEGNLVMASPSAPALVGYTSLDEIIGKNIAEKFYFNPDDRRQFLASIMEKKKLADYEITLKKRDGTPVVVSANCQILYDNAGHMTGIDGFFRDITTRKQTEQALRDSEKRYRNVVEDQTELICRFTPGGVLTFVNDAYCRYFGLDRKDCIGQHHTVRLHSDDAERMRLHLNSLRPENPAGTIEHRIQMPDGKTHWQVWTDRAHYNSAGALVEFQSVGRDITERQEQAQQIRESEERFRMITELSPFPISLIDKAGNFQYLNKRFEELFGYTLADIPTGQDWFRRAFPDTSLRTIVISTWKQDREHAFGGVIQSRVFPVTCKDGTLRHIRFRRGTLGHDEQFVICEDLTHQTESEQLRSVLDTIARTTNDAIIGMTLDGTIISWNKTAERLYGYLAEEVTGKSVNILIPDMLREQVLLLLRRAGSGETIEHFKTRWIRKDELPVDISLTVSPVRDRDAQIVGISTVAKKAEETKEQGARRGYQRQQHRHNPPVT